METYRDKNINKSIHYYMDTYDFWQGEIAINSIDLYLPHHLKDNIKQQYPQTSIDFFEKFNLNWFNLLETEQEDKLFDLIIILIDIMQNGQSTPIVCHYISKNRFHCHPGRSRVKAMRYLDYQSVYSIVQYPKGYKQSNLNTFEQDNYEVYYKQGLRSLTDAGWMECLEIFYSSQKFSADSTGTDFSKYNNYARTIAYNFLEYIKNNKWYARENYFEFVKRYNIVTDEKGSNLDDAFLHYLGTQSLS